MDVVIWAGGKGTRLEEKTKGMIPKPMVGIGGYPILFHIMDIYKQQGYDGFRVLGGHQQEVINKWIEREREGMLGRMSVDLVDTGKETQTGGRLLSFLQQREGVTDPFMATYGDGLADINLRALLDHHRRMKKEHGVLVTLTAVKPPARFGAIQINGGLALNFAEKVAFDDGWINGGFYVIEQDAVQFVANSRSQWERDVLPTLAMSKRLAAYRHPGWWHMMDTPRDLRKLQELFKSGKAPWNRLHIPFSLIDRKEAEE